MLPGVAVHVIHRGNNRESCFFRDEDRAFYLFHLDRLLPRAGCRLHAYCLMTNHVHLLLTPATATACGLLMKGIAQLYAQYVNRNYRRSGYLWESRFKSCLVQSENYVLSCYRYIELNPVRAGGVARPGDYLWSELRSKREGRSFVPHPASRRICWPE
jgi:putative transposase